MGSRIVPTEPPDERMPKPAVLIVSEAEAESAHLAAALTAEGWAAFRVGNGEAAINVLDRTPIDALITRLRAPRIRGLHLLALARERNPDVGAVLIIDKTDEEQATRAMRRGVVDFQVRPVNIEKAVTVIGWVLAHQHLAAELVRAHQRLELRYGFAGIVGDSGAIVRALSQVKEIATLECAVFLTGEPGTGKSHIARVIHQNSLRRGGPFVAFDCEALPPRLAARELFGAPAERERRRRPGRLEVAQGGTLYLHQVAALPKDLQARVVEVLQTHALRPELEREPVDVDVRLIASSRTGLDGLIGREQLHAGLYDLLGAAQIALPPLRHRRRDVPLLVRHFLAEAAPPGAPVPAVAPEALDLLEAFSWPGNVRELRNTIRHALAGLTERGVVGVADLPEDIRHPHTRGNTVMLPIGTALQEAERRLILETIRMTGGNRVQAARALQVSVRTLYRKLRAYGVDGLDA
jgi:two-component system, NtrC family, response regulator HydG